MTGLANADAPRRGRVPAPLDGGPFRLSDVRRLGVSRDRLCGSAFRLLIRSVYVSAATVAGLDLEARSWAPAGHIVPRRRAELVPHEGLGEHE